MTDYMINLIQNIFTVGTLIGFSTVIFYFIGYCVYSAISFFKTIAK
jgi:hypothetical protein